MSRPREERFTRADAEAAYARDFKNHPQMAAFYEPPSGQVLDLSRLGPKREHDLRAGLKQGKKLTVCLRCGAQWGSPKPDKDRSHYVPRYCVEEEKGPPVGVYILMNDAGGRLP